MTIPAAALILLGYVLILAIAEAWLGGELRVWPRLARRVEKRTSGRAQTARPVQQPRRA